MFVMACTGIIAVPTTTRLFAGGVVAMTKTTKTA
jgi:hypothetical protein